MLLEELKEKCNIIAAPVSEERLNAAIEEVVRRSHLNLDNADEGIIPSAIMAAIFDDMKRCCLNGSWNERAKKLTKKEYNNIRLFIPSSY